MKHVRLTVAAAVWAIAFAPATLARSKGIERLYILECGQGHTGDLSRWTPGRNVNVPIDIVDNCYLKAQLWINHDKPQRETLKLSPASYE
jgi:hypothetical protein